MRLEYDDPRAVNLAAILLDGKPITLTTVNSVDTEEGWVKSYIPKVDKKALTSGESVVESAPFETELVTRHGKVELVWKTNVQKDTN